MADCQLEVLAGALPGPYSESTSMGLIEWEFQLTWLLIPAILSKPEMNISSVYTWTGDTAEGVSQIFPGQSMITPVYIRKIIRKYCPPQ